MQPSLSISTNLWPNKELSHASVRSVIISWEHAIKSSFTSELTHVFHFRGRESENHWARIQALWPNLLMATKMPHLRWFHPPTFGPFPSEPIHVPVLYMLLYYLACSAQPHLTTLKSWQYPCKSSLHSACLITSFL